MVVRRALSVGINKHPGSPLRGCVNDSNILSDLLRSKFNYQVKQLLDDQATKANVIKALVDMASSSKAGDSYVIHISSHGTQIPDTNGDESDGLDEAFVMYFKNKDEFEDCLLVDDNFGALLKLFHKESKVTVLIDCCHSGTGTRAPIYDAFNMKSNPHVSEPPDVVNRYIDYSAATGNTRSFTTKITPPFKAIYRNPFNSLIDYLMVLFKKTPVYQKSNTVIDPQLVSILFTAAKSEEYAADAKFNNGYFGAFTRSLVDTINITDDLTISNVYNELCEKIRGKFDQTPQLEIVNKSSLSKKIFD